MKLQQPIGLWNESAPLRDGCRRCYTVADGIAAFPVPPTRLEAVTGAHGGFKLSPPGECRPLRQRWGSPRPPRRLTRRHVRSSPPRAEAAQRSQTRADPPPHTLCCRALPGARHTPLLCLPPPPSDDRWPLDVPLAPRSALRAQDTRRPPGWCALRRPRRAAEKSIRVRDGGEEPRDAPHRRAALLGGCRPVMGKGLGQRWCVGGGGGGGEVLSRDTPCMLVAALSRRGCDRLVRTSVAPPRAAANATVAWQRLGNARGAPGSSPRAVTLVGVAQGTCPRADAPCVLRREAANA